MRDVVPTTVGTGLRTPDPGPRTPDPSDSGRPRDAPADALGLTSFGGAPGGTSKEARLATYRPASRRHALSSLMLY